MSPYLFLLVADVLQALIKWDGSVRHPIDHDLGCCVLQYADDTLVVMRGSEDDAARLRTLLDQFSNATSLKINYSKSVVVPMHMDEEVKRDGFPQTYLGLPLSNTKLHLNALAPYIAKSD
ncbi:hypothetical protein U9M48_041552 [Paspalum notatum var. saurae]|uniref:Reverse transcriptase domain-containing protein n=1 Tax=Paspalum notatum var. saurae TaxID=547442 RepID=A0AAQ3UNL5_PASNO